jgi:hypothetical protein
MDLPMVGLAHQGIRDLIEIDVPELAVLHCLAEIMSPTV